MINGNQITFRLATIDDKPLIKQWWTKPHVMEFWDNSDSMWQNVENYFQGKKELFDYWIGFYNSTPFSLLMTSEIEKNLPSKHPYSRWVDIEGLTMSIDFMIGEEAFLGKGLGHLTLTKFANFLREEGVTALIIDPSFNNARSNRVYQKAGF
jgi:RimJ/RimL family protein N-acetyltransferase